MSLCWSARPGDRPTASQMVSCASAPEFARLADIVSVSKAAATVSGSVGGVTAVSARRDYGKGQNKHNFSKN